MSKDLDTNWDRHHKVMLAIHIAIVILSGAAVACAVLFFQALP